MQIVVDENIPQWQLFASYGQVTRLPGRSISNAEVKNADALIVRSVTRVDEQLLAGSRVRFVGTCTIGTDHLDLDYLQRRAIAWSNAPGCNAQAVAEYVLACLHVLCANTGRDLHQLCYGIVGVGQVGGRLAALLQALGLQVLLCDPPRQQQEPDLPFVDLDSLLERCDVITLHTPLQLQGQWPTRHLLGARQLSGLRRDAWLLNAARGAVVDNQALLDCLRRRPDLQVVLDVWEQEPDFDIELAALCRIATPHIAGYSLDGKIRGTEMVARQMASCMSLPAPVLASYPPAPLQAVELSEHASASEQLAALCGLLYNPLLDDLAFRRLPGLPQADRCAGFDRLRKNYPPRRELSTLREVKGLAEELREFARLLGLD